MKKNKKVGIVIIIILVLIIIASIFFGGDSESDSMLDLVQNGYLGNYNTVSIKDVMEYTWADGTWEAYETDDDKKIAEYYLDRDKNLIQFMITGEDSFEVVHLKYNGKVSQTAFETKKLLDQMYQDYKLGHSDVELDIDFSTDNVTTDGHRK